MPTDKDFDDYDLDEKYVTTLDEVFCKKETPKALLIVFDVDDDGTEDTAWIPKSMLHKESEVEEEGDAGLLVFKRWLAEQEGWA